MRRRLLSFLLLLVSIPVFAQEALEAAPDAAAATAEGPAAGLRVVGTYPLPGERLRNEIVLYFNEELAPVENAATALIIEPAVAGETRVEKNFIRFRNNALKAPVYQVRVSPEVRSASGQAPDEAVYSFSTQENPKTSVRFDRVDSEHLVLRLNLAVPIAPDQLQAHLELRDVNGGNVAWTNEQAEASLAHRLVLPVNTAWPVTLTLRAGWSGTVALAGLEAAPVLTYPSAEPLTANATWVNDPPAVKLVFNATVFPEVVSQFLQITDPTTGEMLGFYADAVEATKNARFNVTMPETPLKEVLVTVRAGLPAGDRMLSEAVTRVLVPGEIPLQLDYADWEERGTADPVLRVRFNRPIEVDALRQRLQVEPAIEGLEVSVGTYNQTYVKGAWKTGTEYTVTLAEAGGSEAIDIPVSEVPKVEAVEFGYDEKLYFPKQSIGPLPLKARNKTKTLVRVHQLFPSNIVAALRDMENDKTDERFGELFAKEIVRARVGIPDRPDTEVTVPLDLQKIVPQGLRGVFGLTLPESNEWQSTKLVVWTHIGLLAHWQDNEVMVFAHDLFTLAPLPTAKVTMYSMKSQVLGTANTDARGIAHLNALDPRLGTPKVVVVETEDDYTFLELNPRFEDETGFTGGMPLFDSSAYDAFMYSDRTLYRPGELAHLRWVVRTGAGAAVANVPLQLRVLNPKGQELLVKPTTLSELGTGGFELQTETAYLTGKYAIELRVPEAETPINTYFINLEEFVPSRLEAKVTVDKPLWLPKQEQAITVQANHLFGAPAAERQATAHVILRKGEYTSEQWPGYRFGNDSVFKTDIRSLDEKTTDASGVAAFTYTYEPLPEVTFPLDVTVSGQVSELGGRAITTTTEAKLLPSDTLLGVGVETPDAQTVRVSVAAITPEAAPAAVTTVKVTLEHERWNYFVRRFGGHNEPRWDKTFIKIEERDVPLEAGKGLADFALPSSWGYYRVRVSSDATSQYSTRSFYAYSGRIEAVDTPRPTLIKLVTDKPEYAVGEEVALRVESPFDGQGIVVLQGEAIQKAFPVAVQGGVGTVRFTVGQEQYPNLWVEVTVAHTPEPGKPQVYPYSSFAMLNVPVRNVARQITVTFPGLPEEVRPAQEIVVPVATLTAAGQPVSAEVTLALVDEGIHNILGYDNPDPYTFFGRTRQSTFQRAHYYDKVAYDFVPTQIGGDLIARRLGKDSPEIADNWIKPVALWTGTFRTDAQGQARVPVTLPEFNGQLRLVAVAVTPEATGAGAAKLFVRRPFLMQTSLPRFVLPEDTFTSRVVFYNTTDAAATARVAWKATGTLGALEGAQEVALGAKGEASIAVDFAAGATLGQGQVDWTATVVDAAGQTLETLEAHMPLPVLAPAAYSTTRSTAVIAPGTEQTFQNTLYHEDARAEVKIQVSGDARLRLQKALDYAVEYPYGCLEQTTSRLMPLYLLRKSHGTATGTEAQAKKMDTMIRGGVDRLFSMQVPGGGLGMWPGAPEPYPYGSIYALHFLTLLQNGGEVKVPEAGMKALRQYVSAVSKETSDPTESGYYRRAYAYYVLALNGDLNAIKQIERFNSIAIPRTARFLLAAALAVNTQDPARVEQFLNAGPTTEFAVRELSGTLSSPVRNAAVELLALVQMGVQDARVQERVELLLRHLERDERLNTQESSFVVSALALYLDTLPDTAPAAEVTGPHGHAVLDGSKIFEKTHAGAGGVFTVKNTGQVPVYVYLVTSGIPLTPVGEAVAEGIAISRTLRLAGGEEIALDAIVHGQNYLVDLTLNASEEIENVVVSDLLPAGLEIMNPRLDSDATAALEGSGSLTPSYLEIRDDRLVLAFDRLEPGQRHFYYLVRAVTPGTFQQPAAIAEAMYAPELHGNSAAGKVTIVASEAPAS